MKIVVNTEEVEKQITAYVKDTERRLRSMVREFAFEVAFDAALNTPLGDEDKYRPWYISRERRTGMTPVKGFAQGSWRFSKTDNAMFVPRYNKTPGVTSGQALESIGNDLVNYKLGDSFFITNTGPYIQRLENGYSPQAPMGIMQPTIDDILQTYKINLKSFFDRGLYS